MAGETSRRGFLKASGAALGWLAIGCADGEIVAAPPGQGGIPVVPPPNLPIETELDGPTAVRGEDGELLAWIGPGSIYLWPAGGARPGPRFVATTSNVGPSGGYGFQLDRPAGSGWPLNVIYSIDGDRTWEIGLDMGDDASGQGRGPDFVLAYDSSDPPGDRFRMAPGGYTLHSYGAGSPSTGHRFHIVGGGPEVDRAENVLYVQSGSADNPGGAETLIRGQGYHADDESWGREVFRVDVDGTIVGRAIVAEISGGHDRDLVTLRAGDGDDRAWLRWTGPRGDWRIGLDPAGGELVVRCDAGQRFRFAADGRAWADAGWLTFSPAPPRPAAEMTARDWRDWALHEAAKPVKPYDGVPTEDHPRVVDEAARTGRPAAEIAAEEQTRYGKDIARVAIGTAHWADRVQEALARARTLDELRGLLGLEP